MAIKYFPNAGVQRRKPDYATVRWNPGFQCYLTTVPCRFPELDRDTQAHGLYYTEPEWICFGFWFFIASLEPLPHDDVLRSKPFKDTLPQSARVILNEVALGSWVMYSGDELPKLLRWDEVVTYGMVEWGRHQFHLFPFIAYELHMRATGHTRAIHDMLRTFSPYLHGTVADIGAGPGSNTRVLSECIARSGREGEILMIDPAIHARLAMPIAATAILTDLRLTMVKQVGLWRTSVIDTAVWRKNLREGALDVAVVSYILPWVSQAIAVALENIAWCMKPRGHLVVLGEDPDRATPSLFLARAELEEVGPGVPFPELISTTEKAGLILVQKEERKVITPEPKDCHTMFGAVFRKE